MARSKREMPEKVTGPFSALPHNVYDSNSHKGASINAKALLGALTRQLNGQNNGHLQLTSKWLAKYGFTSPAINIKTRKELIERDLIVQTKWGGLNMGPDLFAVTWVQITNFVNLDITSKGFVKGAYLHCKLPPTPKRKQPSNKRFSNSNSTVSVTETETDNTDSVTETKIATFKQSAVTVSENNVSIPIHVRKNSLASIKRRIVGVKGKSGIKVKK